MRRFFLIAALIGTCFITCAAHARAAEPIEKIKAVFLFKFFDYVSWDTPKGSNKTLCTFGYHPFERDLEFIAKMRQQDTINVMKIDSLTDAKKCNVLYIHDIDNKADLAGIPATANALIVSSEKRALQHGGMIVMEEKSGRVQLSINLKAAESKKLKISSRLLQISNVIR